MYPTLSLSVSYYAFCLQPGRYLYTANPGDPAGTGTEPVLHATVHCAPMRMRAPGMQPPANVLALPTTFNGKRAGSVQ